MKYLQVVERQAIAILQEVYRNGVTLYLQKANSISVGMNIIGVAAAGFQDASLWEEAKRKGDPAIKKIIDDALNNTSVTVVFNPASLN